jgi:menaquinone-dependent protoporphyrinogen oxidase
MRVLVTAATRYGSTGEIAATFGREIARHGVPTMVVAPGEVADLDEVDAVVLGSAVYAGHWLEPATVLVDRCGPAWASRSVWLFLSAPVGDPARKLVQRGGFRSRAEIAARAAGIAEALLAASAAGSPGR